MEAILEEGSYFTQNPHSLIENINFLVQSMASHQQQQHSQNQNPEFTQYLSQSITPNQVAPMLNQSAYHSRLPGMSDLPPPAAADAAASFFAKAAQKIAKQQKRAQKAAEAHPHPFPTNFGLSLTNNPPSAPPGLFRNVDRRTSTAGKVKVALRLSPENTEGIASPGSFVSVDARHKQVLLSDPRLAHTPGPGPAKPPTNAPPKMFAFDHVFAEDAAQAEICASTLPEVLQSVINGNDGCIFGYGHANLGKSFTMIGEDTSLQTIGVVPCAISWLFRLINEQKQKTGARFSVRVSSVEIFGKDEHVKDLLAEQDTSGSTCTTNESPGIFLQPRDPSGFHLQNHSELRAATADKAAFYLDAALAARTKSPDLTSSRPEECLPAHMIFTLHLYQYRVDKTKKNGVCGGRSRLHLIDLGNCNKPSGPGSDAGQSCSGTGTGTFLSYSALGNVLLSLMNGARHVPHRDSKLTQLLKEVIGGGNCCTVLIAHISCKPEKYQESLPTIQLAHKIHRTKKRKTKLSSGPPSSSRGAGASSSSEYSENSGSSCDESGGFMPKRRLSSQFRPMGALRENQYMSSDYSSSSEQSCDTVIYRGPDGRMLSDHELTDNERPPQVARLSSDPAGNKSSSRESSSPPKAASLSDTETFSGHRKSYTCNTPAESDQEGSFLIRPIPTPLATNQRKQISLSDNEQILGSSSRSLCSDCEAPYENSAMFEPRCKQNGGSGHIPRSCDSTGSRARSPRYSNTSDSSIENIPKLLVGSNFYPNTSPCRGVVSDSEVVCGVPRTLRDSSVNNDSNLSFITEEAENNGANNQSSHNRNTRFAQSAQNINRNNLLKPASQQKTDFNSAAKKSASSASFFRQTPAKDDVWQVRKNTEEKCKSSNFLKKPQVMSDGERLQSSAMLVVMGPKAAQLCIHCSTGNKAKCVNNEAQSPGSRRSSCPGSYSGSGTPVNSSLVSTPKSSPSRKFAFFNKFRRSRTPEESPKPKPKRFTASPKSRSAQLSPSRKHKIKIPVLENYNRTPENSPPMARKTSKNSVTSGASSDVFLQVPATPVTRSGIEIVDLSNQMRNSGRGAFSDSEEMSTPVSSLRPHFATSIPNSFSDDVTVQRGVSADLSPNRMRRNSPSSRPAEESGIHQYETIDRMGAPNSGAAVTHDKALLMQKFLDARVSKCQTAQQSTYRLSTHTDSGLESIGSDLTPKSPLCHPDLIESHCPPQRKQVPQYPQYITPAPNYNVSSCACQHEQRLSQAINNDVSNSLEGEVNTKSPARQGSLLNFGSNKGKDMKSLPCSPFVCSKSKKRSKSAEKKASSVFHSFFSLKSKKNDKNPQCTTSHSSQILAPNCQQKNIAIVAPTMSQSQVIARVLPVQRNPGFASEGSKLSPESRVTAATDSDSGVDIGGVPPSRRRAILNPAQSSLAFSTNDSNCRSCRQPQPNNEALMSASSPLPGESSGYESGQKRDHHLCFEACKNPTRCKNIKKKLLNGPSAEIHKAALSGTGLKACPCCSNLQEYWVDAPPPQLSGSGANIPENFSRNMMLNNHSSGGQVTGMGMGLGLGSGQGCAPLTHACAPLASEFPPMSPEPHPDPDPATPTEQDSMKLLKAQNRALQNELNYTNQLINSPIPASFQNGAVDQLMSPGIRRMDYYQAENQKLQKNIDFNKRHLNYNTYFDSPV